MRVEGSPPSTDRSTHQPMYKVLQKSESMLWKTLHLETKIMIFLNQFEATIWAEHNTTWELNKWNNICSLILKDENVKIQNKTTENVIKSNKCNQCDYASSQTADLRKHLKTHSGEKSN